MAEGVSKEKHRHKFMDEVYKIEKGWLEIQVGDRNIKLTPGKVLIVKPDIEHEIIDYELGTEIFLVRTPSVKEDREVVGEN